MGQAGLVRLQGPQERARRGVLVRRVRDDDHVVGRLRQHQARTRSSSSRSSPLPYYADVPGAPQNTMIGGASLWVMGGKKPEEYKACAKFFTFLSQPEMQAELAQGTGYLPITTGGVRADRRSPASTEQNPGTDVAVQQMIRKTTDKSRGIRLGNYVQIRGVDGRGARRRLGRQEDRQGSARRRSKRGNELLVRFAEGQQVAGPTTIRVIAWEKRVRFQIRAGCHMQLLAPQIIVSLVFFFWPAAQALYQSLLVQDAFGDTVAVRLVRQLPRPVPRRAATSRRSRSRRCSRCSSPVIGLAVVADAGGVRRPRRPGRRDLQDLLIWPYAVAPAVAGVLWLFLFNPTLGVVAHWLRGFGIDWDSLLNGNHAHDPDRHRRRLEADQLQLPVLPRRPAVDPEVADRGRRDRRRRAGPALLDDRVPAAVADDVLPARRQHRLRVLRHVRRSSTRRRRAVPARRPRSSSTRCTPMASRALDLGGSAAQSVVLMAIVITLTVLQFRYRRAESAV